MKNLDSWLLLILFLLGMVCGAVAYSYGDRNEINQLTKEKLTLQIEMQKRINAYNDSLGFDEEEEETK